MIFQFVFVVTTETFFLRQRGWHVWIRLPPRWHAHSIYRRIIQIEKYMKNDKKRTQINKNVRKSAKTFLWKYVFTFFVNFYFFVFLGLRWRWWFDVFPASLVAWGAQYQPTKTFFQIGSVTHHLCVTILIYTTLYQWQF